jgi:hypothetical protein
MSWARLLKRVFDIDIEHCPNCGGSMKIIAAIEDPPVIVKILRPSRPAHPRPAARTGAAFRSIPNSLRAKNRLPKRADGGAHSEFERAARSAKLRAVPTAVPPEPTEAKPQTSLIAPTIDTFAGSAIYLRSEKRWFKFPIHGKERLPDGRIGTPIRITGHCLRKSQ